MRFRYIWTFCMSTKIIEYRKHEEQHTADSILIWSGGGGAGLRLFFAIFVRKKKYRLGRGTHDLACSWHKHGCSLQPVLGRHNAYVTGVSGEAPATTTTGRYRTVVAIAEQCPTRKRMQCHRCLADAAVTLCACVFLAWTLPRSTKDRAQVTGAPGAAPVSTAGVPSYL